MRYVLKFIGLLIISAYVASWLRMADPRLTLRSWADLPGKPMLLWVTATVFYPVFELLQSWPAYIIGGMFFALIIKFIYRSSLAKTIALGAALGFSIYLAYASFTGEWLMRRHSLIFEQLVIYTLAAGFFGFCYHIFILERRATIS